jgi:serine protease inhibitor
MSMSRCARRLSVVALAALSGCGDGTNDAGPAAGWGEPVAPETALAATASNAFACDLYARLAAEGGGNNLFFSPYSLTGVLSMAVEGARGETARQMGQALHFPEAARRTGDGAREIPWDTGLIHTQLGLLHKRFNERSRDDAFELRVANALWGEKTCPFRKEFTDTIARHYGTGGIVPADFLGDAEGTRKQINAWAEDQTRNRIKNLVPPGAVGELTRLILTNAIYFKGEWAEVFQPGLTTEDDFRRAGDAKVRVPLMNRCVDSARYAAFNGDGSLFDTPLRVRSDGKDEKDEKRLYPDDRGFAMLELPYKGNELSMVVILPRVAGGLDALEKSIVFRNRLALIGKIRQRTVDVFLPRFRMDTSYNISQTLRSMGMIRAFNAPGSPDVAEFGGMSESREIFISAILHKAFVEVNEQGTEAAAATAAFAAESAVPEPVEMIPFVPIFRADHPFLFLIRDRTTGCILFLGRVTDPTAG